MKDFVDGMAFQISELAAGFGGESISASEILAEERALFVAFSFDIQAPTIATWMEVFAARFDVITRGTLSHLLDNLRDTCNWYAAATIFNNVNNSRLPPYTVAVGAFSLGLVALHMLSPDIVRPDGFPAESWRYRLAPFTTIVANKHAQSVDTAALPCGAVHAALQFAVGCNATVLRSSARSFVEGLNLLPVAVQQ